MSMRGRKESGRRAALACVAAALLCAITPAPARALLVPLGVGAAAQSQGAGGVWGPVLNWINAVHLALMPNGKVIMYDEKGQYRLYDPETDQLTAPTHPGYIAMCGAMAHMADGKVFVMGGGGPIIADALRYCSIYDPFADTWVDLPNMNKGRWYGINVTLPNGNILVTAGAGALKPTQVWQTSGDPNNPANGSYRTFSNLIESVYWYPRAFVAPNGMVFDAAPDDETGYYDLRGAGKYIFVAESHYGYRKKGTAVMYRPGKIILIGGAQTDGSDSTATCEVIDLNDPNPTWRYTNPMAYSRKDHTAVILPDGRVLVAGGYTNTSNFPTNAVEVWDPDTEQWTTWASHSIQRGYHGTTALLPDGRVIGAGGNRLTAQIFSPPYLSAGARPTITSAPAVGVHGTTINIATPDAESVTAVNLVRLGTTTHNPNYDQRFLPLTFTKKEDGSIDAVIPDNQNVAIVGYYMLFLINSNGVPSVGKFIRIAQPDFKGPDGLVADIVSARTIQLDWNDNSAAESNFVISRSTDGVNYEIIGTVDANVTGFTHYPVEENTHYRYQVYAVNGAGERVYSNIAEAQTPVLTTPAIPFKLTAKARSGPQIVLNWVPRDDLAYEFIIERSLANGGYLEFARVDGRYTTYTDEAVEDGKKYYYRVRATNPIGTSLPSGYVTAVAKSGATGNSVIGLLLSPLTVTGGTNVTGTVTLKEPALQPETVLLWSDKPQAQTPASVTVQEGESTATFTIATTPVFTQVIPIISAKLVTTRQRGITIKATALSAVAFSPNAVFGGVPGAGTITLTGPAPAGGMVVTLSSSNPIVTVPETVTVPEGVTSMPFQAATQVVYASTQATITAVGNGISKMTTLTVKQHGVNSLTLTPKTVTGGAESLATVVLNAPAGPGGVIVTLTSNSAAAQVPANVTVPEGATEATFTVTTSPVTDQLKATIRATIGVSYKQAGLTINP